MKIKQPCAYRIIGVILCIPTIISMYMDWVNILFLDKLRSSFKIFDFINSKFSIIELLDIMRKFDSVYANKATLIINTILVIEIISTISMAVLMLAFLFFDSKWIRITSVISFVITSSMFGTFLYSINMSNEYLSDKGGGSTKFIEPTAWPYIMFAITLLIIIDVFCGYITNKQIQKRASK